MIKFELAKKDGFPIEVNRCESERELKTHGLAAENPSFHTYKGNKISLSEVNSLLEKRAPQSVKSHQSIGGKPLLFVQCMSQEEAQKHSLPQGQYHYWMYEGEKITDAGTIMALILGSVKDGTFKPEQSSIKNLAAHYGQLMDLQRKLVTDALDAPISESIEPNVRNQIIERKKEMSDAMKNLPNPSTDGLFRIPEHIQSKILGKKA